MPKTKTSKTAAKRIKITASGKMLRRQTRQNHLLSKKRPKKKRALKELVAISGREKREIRRLVAHR